MILGEVMGGQEDWSVATETIEITPELLRLISTLAEFKCARPPSGSLEPERLLALRNGRPSRASDRRSG